jgi:hypothetical protein
LLKNGPPTRRFDGWSLYGPSMSHSTATDVGRTVRRAARLVIGLAAALALLATPVMPHAAANVPDDVATLDAPAAVTGVRLIAHQLVAVVGPPLVGDLPNEGAPAARTPDVSARLLIENTGTETLAGLRVVVELHPRATSRSQLRAALDGAGPQTVGQLISELAVPSLAPGDIAQLQLDVAGASASFVDIEHDITVRPLVMTVVRGSLALDVVRTAVVGVARRATSPLETAIVLPLDGQPLPRGGSASDRAGDLRPGERLDRLVTAAEAAPAGSITLAPAAHTLEDLAAAAAEALPGTTDLLERVRALAAQSNLVSSTYALADVASLAERDGTEALARAAVTEGRRRLGPLASRSVGASHLAVGPQTPTTLDLTPVDVLLVRWDDAAGLDLTVNPTGDLPPALRTAQTPSGRSLQVLVADPWIEQLLKIADGGAGYEMDAHRIVVESATAFAEEPGTAGRTLLIIPPLGWDAPGQLGTELTRRATDAPWLRIADPVTVVSRAATSTAGWAPTPTFDLLLDPILVQLATTSVRFTGFKSTVASLEEPPPVFGRGDDLLVATTTWPSGDRITRARAILDDLGTQMDEAIGVITIPGENVITLASERGTIPVTVQHPAGVSLDVIIEVTPQGRLVFEQGSSQPMRLDADGTGTVSFEARALGRGTFPLAITVRTPEGGVVLARALVSVRATAVSRPALIGIGVVVVGLLALGRRRKPTGAELQVVR